MGSRMSEGRNSKILIDGSSPVKSEMRSGKVLTN